LAVFNTIFNDLLTLFFSGFIFLDHPAQGDPIKISHLKSCYKLDIKHTF